MVNLILKIILLYLSIQETFAKIHHHHQIELYEPLNHHRHHRRHEHQNTQTQQPCYVHYDSENMNITLLAEIKKLIQQFKKDRTPSDSRLEENLMQISKIFHNLPTAIPVKVGTIFTENSRKKLKFSSKNIMQIPSKLCIREAKTGRKQGIGRQRDQKQKSHVLYYHKQKIPPH